MQKALIVGGLILGLLLATVVVAIVYVRGVQIHAMTLHENYDAKQKGIQTSHDNMWKTIKEKYQLGEEYKDGFIQSIQAVSEGRKGGALFKSVQENMAGLSPEVTREIMATIEGKRDMFKRDLDSSTDVAREYNTYLQSGTLIPNSWIIGGQKIDAKIITSTRTDNAYKTGKDDETVGGK